MQKENPSPCESCTKVPEPRECTAKFCTEWRDWWLARWERLRAPLQRYVRRIRK